MKEIIDKLDFIKIKTDTLLKTLSREWKHKLQTGRKYLKKTYLVKDYYPKYIKKAYKLTIRKHTWLKNGPKTSTDTSPKKMDMAYKHMKRCATSYALKCKFQK